MHRFLAAWIALGLLAVPAAQAQPTTIGAELYFVKATGGETQDLNGFLWLVYRTSEKLPASGKVRIGTREPYSYLISTPAHCYGARAYVFKKDTVAVGDSVPVRVTNHGAALLDESLVVKDPPRNWGTGKTLGCAADPKTRAFQQALTGLPQQAPSVFFFTADAGPAIDHLVWRHWGANRTVGRGILHDGCTGPCPPPHHQPVRFALSHPVYDDDLGLRLYSDWCLIERKNGRWVGHVPFTHKPCH